MNSPNEAELYLREVLNMTPMELISSLGSIVFVIFFIGMILGVAVGAHLNSGKSSFKKKKPKLVEETHHHKAEGHKET